MRATITVLTLLLLVLQYRLWLGAGGIEEYISYKRDLSIQQEYNDLLLARNEQLVYEINDLKTGLDAIEYRARYDFGMINSDETFFLLIGE